MLGLYGEWGYGKTSALNLLEYALNESGTATSRPSLPRAQVIRFTPWLYADVDALLTAFFGTLADGIDGFEINNAERRSTLRRTLTGLSMFVKPAAKLAGLFLAGPDGMVATGAVVDEAAPAESAGEAAGGALEGTAESLSGGEASFRKLRDDAEAALRDLASQKNPRRVVVLIDDLDRASGGDEVLAMLKLVKLVASLPNISYVIAMDRRRVQDLLSDHVSPAFGETFLDKIIQIPVTLPPVRPQLLARLLIDDAIEIVESASLDSTKLKMDWSAWNFKRAPSFVPLLQSSLATLRDIARVSNAFRFALLTGDGPAEVDPVDLLLLCVLQALHPDVYERVRQSREFLLHENRDWAGFSRDDAHREAIRAWRRKRLAKIAGRLWYGDPNESRSGSAVEGEQADLFTLDILEFLFPNAVDSSSQADDLKKARNDLRIQSPQRFDGYFRLYPLDGEVPHKLAQALFDELRAYGEQATDGDDPDDFGAAIIQRLEEMSIGERDSLLRQLDDRIGSATRAEVASILSALVALVDSEESDLNEPVAGMLFTAAKVLVDFQMGRGDELRSADFDLARDTFIQAIVRLPARVAAQFAKGIACDREWKSTLGPDRIKAIAGNGLTRSEEFFAATPNVFEALEGIEGCDAVWTQRHLALLAGAMLDDGMYPPLQQYLERLVRADDGAVSEAISIAAGWGTGPGLSRRSKADELSSLANFLPVDLIEERSRDLVQKDVMAGRWPLLVREFIALVDGTQG